MEGREWFAMRDFNTMPNSCIPRTYILCNTLSGYKNTVIQTIIN